MIDIAQQTWIFRYTFVADGVFEGSDEFTVEAESLDLATSAFFEDRLSYPNVKVTHVETPATI